MSLVITDREYQDVENAVRTLMKKHKLKPIPESTKKDSITFSKGISVWSFGEYIKLNVIPKKGLNIIYINSIPKGGYWRHDWGEHIRNERKLAKELLGLLGPEGTEAYI